MSDLTIDPKKTAVVVVDMQNAFIRDEGSMMARGLDANLLKPTVGPVKRVVDLAHRVGMPVIYTRYVLRSDYRDAGRRKERILAAGVPSLVQGTWDVEVIDELKPILDSDYVLDKTRCSSFYNTNLEVILRGEGVDTLIVCGVTTEVCVESTVRDAQMRDYAVIVPTDAVAAFDVDRHAGALKIIEYGFGKLTTTDTIEAALGASSGRPASS